MKISRMNTEDMAAMICRLTPPVCRMLRDPEALAAFDSADFGTASSLPPMAGAAMVWEKLTPVLLHKHRDDFFQALSVLTGKEKEVIRRQTGLETLKDIQAVWDEELMVFFTFAGAAAQGKS